MAVVAAVPMGCVYVYNHPVVQNTMKVRVCGGARATVGGFHAIKRRVCYHAVPRMGRGDVKHGMEEGCVEL